jgi:hypothetical protein
VAQRGVQAVASFRAIPRRSGSNRLDSAKVSVSYQQWRIADKSSLAGDMGRDYASPETQLICEGILWTNGLDAGFF